MQTLWNLTSENKNRISIIEQNGERYTFEQLQRDVIVLSNKLRSSRKQLVLILAKNDYISIVSYSAVMVNNDAVMLMSADIEETLLATIIDAYQPGYIIGDVNHDLYDEYFAGITKRRTETEYEIHQDLSLLLSTSGSTGSLKFVRLSFANLLANAKSIAEYLEITHEDRGLVNLPMNYSYGLSLINSHLFAGATILLSSESVLAKSFWEFVKNEKATSFAGVPYTYQMLQRIGFQKMDLPDLRYFTQAGGRLNEKLVRLFSEYALEHQKSFYLMYGQTEAAPRISYVPPEDIVKKPTSIGIAIPDGRLSLDPETEELIYEGPNVMMGYAADFSDLKKGDELLGRLHTGDLGEVDEDGFYYIKGRIKRFVKLFGLRINLDDIEKKIESALQISVVCVGTDDRMVVVVPNEEKQDSIQSLIENLYKLHKSAFRVKVLEEVPRLANGKVNYEALKELVL
ncbi:phosphatase [Bacillus sp. M6-12]|uniref:AMP-binding protein n=1 Tax=Bacillus sp. M6-12 TaxID=2054166 RepID=UPI000C772F39|nr:AMP-binding protein [Bacillus sp. M6-12]PLS17886.1 phosphatase [Bacillus sp. M6-12]